MEIRCAHCGAKNLIAPDHASLTLCCAACGKTIDLTAIAETLTVDSGLSLAEHLQATVIAPGRGASPGIDRESQPGNAGPGGGPGAEQMLGGYRLERELERTVLGTLYRGEQMTLRRPVFIFILDETLAAEKECASTFLNEARRSAALVHPQITRVYDIGSAGKSHYVVSEFIKGDSLAKNLREGRCFTPEKVIQAGMEIARGLAVAHSMQLLHWGLSPKNIYFTAAGEVRLAQFGIAHALFAGAQPARGIREAGYFLPPGNLLTETSPQIDLLALGGVLYAMLTGVLPGADATAAPTLAPLPELAAPALKIPPGLARLLQRIFSEDPREHPASASDLAQELGRLSLEKASVQSPAPPLRQGGMKPNKRRYKRFRADISMKISPAEISRKKQEEYLAKLENLSENGAYILTASPLPSGTFVNLSFEMKSGAGSRVEALGIVRWRNDSPGNVGMGVQFLEVSTNNRRHLNDFVDRQTALDMVQSLASSALHKTILRALSQNWDKTIPTGQIMRETGASKRLFDRTLSDFEKIGLVKPRGNKLCCIRPLSESVETAIEEILRGPH